MSVNEILQELETLSADELKAVRDKIESLHEVSEEETPEMLAAINEGLRSLKEEGSIPIEDVMKEIETWRLKSS